METLLNATVYPSSVKSVAVDDFDGEEYEGGAHRYIFRDSLGFNSETKEAEYADSEQIIDFVMKDPIGGIKAGVQSEQLLIALIDRHKKLNAKFPSREGAIAITKMEEALHWLRARVEERINRGVMGDLKK